MSVEKPAQCGSRWENGEKPVLSESVPKKIHVKNHVERKNKSTMWSIAVLQMLQMQMLLQMLFILLVPEFRVVRNVLRELQDILPTVDGRRHFYVSLARGVYPTRIIHITRLQFLMGKNHGSKCFRIVRRRHSLGFSRMQIAKAR